MKTFLAFKLSGGVFIKLINVKMSTIVGTVVILTFMSMIILCSVELSKKKVSYPRGLLNGFAFLYVLPPVMNATHFSLIYAIFDSLTFILQRLTY